MTKMTPEQVDEMAELREQGWSYDRLAARYGVSPGAIHYRCLTVGALSPRARGIIPGDRRRPRPGFGGSCTPFSPDEDARLLQLARDGRPLATIATMLGRARTSTRIRLMTLELKSELA